MEAIGEVLSANITGFIAEAWRSAETAHDEQKGSTANKSLIPSFGSFLKSKSEEGALTVYGVVYDIVTGPQDQHHKPAALKMSRAQLLKEQPQIFALLKTEWHVLIVGYKDSKGCKCALPPYPPEVHDFVFPLEEKELLEISENLEFLRMLSAAPGVPGDELMAATIRNAAAVRPDNYDYLVEAGQHITKLLRDDYDRLGSVLRKIRP